MANTTENKTYFSFQPNVGQQEAFDRLCHFLDENAIQDFFILTGAAGTGKTSVVSAVANYLHDKSIACVLAAPTGRAAHVISSKTNRAAKTIHSLIYIPEVNAAGTVIYKRKENRSKAYTVFMIDESSMVADSTENEGLFTTPNSLLVDLIAYVKQGNAGNKIIFIGDAYQLAPITSPEFSPALCKMHLTNRHQLKGSEFELTKIERQANGSYILDNAELLRTAVKNGFLPPATWKRHQLPNAIGTLKRYALEFVILLLSAYDAHKCKPIKSEFQIKRNYFLLLFKMDAIYFGNNLRLLRKNSGENQSGIALIAGKQKSAVSSWELNESIPPLDVIIKLSDHFGISTKDFIFSDLQNVGDSKKKPLKNNGKFVGDNVGNVVGDRAKNYEENDDLTTTLEPPPKMLQSGGNVYELDTKAAAGLANLLQHTDKFKQLPTLYLPYMGHGFHISLLIGGDSMHATIKDGDRVIATQLTEPATTLREGHIHVLIDKEDGVVCKRVYKAGKDNYQLESDNDIYKPYKRHLRDILAVFKVVQVHTTDLRNYYSDTRREITKLWQAIEEISGKIP